MASIWQKEIFEAALANRARRVLHRKRLTRRQVDRFVGSLEPWLVQMNQHVGRVAAAHAAAQRLQTLPGVDILTATALVGAVSDIHAFRRGRDFRARWGSRRANCPWAVDDTGLDQRARRSLPVLCVT